MYKIEEEFYKKIEDLFANYQFLLVDDFKDRMIKAIKTLHFEYLLGSCKEAKKLLEKYNKEYNLFELIMVIYNKRRRNHQTKSLLLHCFENTLRSTVAINYANHYNKNEDNWFCNIIDINMAKRINRQCKELDLNNTNTFEIFDCFRMMDLQEIINENWNLYSIIFAEYKEYKNQELPPYDKNHLYTKIGQIRKVRNEIFHNKPTKIRFQKDLEILMLRMEFNLKDAINIGNIADGISLQYKYTP
ncbi:MULTISPECIES: hypothetical protein [unclassified Campylobacter]|uniref:hypothetical protein n=1 Tax=unclassified Campylobacter TaxID=2593542 RepID=UPI001BDAD515|nr:MULTISPECIES: hypothetical protein [unclassified Campylobacter]MBT0880821.1 hypothetical protein [Campylobacter sp. 2018MI27]MBT0885146.1 hypothetical protein [Campylobacter sp. 2018MI10]MBZ7980219.1 hypothetical protein [Campylobacter sp. RM12642]MBZ8008044.1 hypothetical protein [Campylobacter sp. RM9334]